MTEPMIEELTSEECALVAGGTSPPADASRGGTLTSSGG